MADERITCPACQSAISPDGRTLFERSAHLSEAEEALGLLEKATARIEELEARVASLEEKKPEPQRDPVKPKKGAHRGVVEKEREGKPESWDW